MEQEARRAQDPMPLPQLFLCPPLTLGQGVWEPQPAQGSQTHAPAQAARGCLRKARAGPWGNDLPLSPGSQSLPWVFAYV